MSNISMISAWGQAEDYNSSCCNNGGSYYQPQGGVLYRVGDQLVTVDVDDTSCGDFGIRVWATISTDSHKWAICYGSMDDAAIMEDAEMPPLCGLSPVYCGLMIRGMILYWRRLTPCGTWGAYTLTHPGPLLAAAAAWSAWITVTAM